MMETKEKQNGILEGVIWKQLLIFFFPILIGTFFQQLYNTTDAVIVGKFVGKEALAAVGGPAATLINLLIGFFTGLSSGAAVIISQYGGPDGELGASLRYLSQRYAMPYPELKGLLTDIGTEESDQSGYQ